MKKYKARTSFRWNVKPEIEEVEVERETEHNVWINGRRHNKRSEYANYYDSFDLAKNALIHCQSSMNKSLEQRLAEGRKNIEILNKMSGIE